MENRRFLTGGRDAALRERKKRERVGDRDRERERERQVFTGNWKAAANQRLS